MFKQRVNDINQIRLPDDFEKEETTSGTMSSTAETIDNFDTNVETIVNPFEFLNIDLQTSDQVDDLEDDSIDNLQTDEKLKISFGTINKHQGINKLLVKRKKQETSDGFAVP